MIICIYTCPPITVRVTLAELNLQAMQPNPMYEGCSSSTYEAMDGARGYPNPHILQEPQYCALNPPPLPKKNVGQDASGMNTLPAAGMLSTPTALSVDKLSTGSTGEDSYTVMHPAGTIGFQHGEGSSGRTAVISTDRYVITHTTEC